MTEHRDQKIDQMRDEEVRDNRRKPYVSPQLIEYGCIEKWTKVLGAFGGDVEGQSSVP